MLPTPSEVSTSTRTPAPWWGTYVPHGWIGSLRTTSFITPRVEALKAAGFTVQLHNIGAINSSGYVPEASFSGLKTWTSVSSKVDPGQRLIGWVSGSESMHVNQTTRHPAIVAFLDRSARNHGLGGLLLDLEPFSNNNPNYLSLLTKVRKALPTTWIAVNAPGNTRWSASFIAEVGSIVDALSPMLYDTGIRDQAAYPAYVSAQLTRYNQALSGRRQLIPSIPSYAANRWHDPAVENVLSASEGLRRASGVPLYGRAVYWWWEMDDTAKAHWASTLP